MFQVFETIQRHRERFVKRVLGRRFRENESILIIIKQDSIRETWGEQGTEKG